MKLKLENFQVLNGGQTLRTIHNYNASSSNNIDKLSKARVLVRFFNISDSELRREIGEYTNSQNSVDAISLASLRDEQIALDKYLKENSVLFIRKKGNIGDLEDTTAFRTTITLERLGQLLLSTYGKPEEVSNKKKEIFGKYYEDLYKNNESLLTSSTIKLIDNFDTIKATYRSSKYEMTIQKIMYVVYISYKSDSCHFNEIIEKFESLLYGYKTKNQIGSAMSRILITNSFKKYIDNEFDIS